MAAQKVYNVSSSDTEQDIAADAVTLHIEDEEAFFAEPDGSQNEEQPSKEAQEAHIFLHTEYKNSELGTQPSLSLTDEDARESLWQHTVYPTETQKIIKTQDDALQEVSHSQTTSMDFADFGIENASIMVNKEKQNFSTKSVEPYASFHIQNDLAQQNMVDEPLMVSEISTSIKDKNIDKDFDTLQQNTPKETASSETIATSTKEENSNKQDQNVINLVTTIDLDGQILCELFERYLSSQALRA